MPGIFGLVTRMPRERAEADLRLMRNAMLHDSSYESATLIDETLGVYVGCAAPAPSFAGVEPLYNERGDVAMLFAGEEYSRPCGRQACADGKRHRTVDTLSYLVNQYEQDEAFPAGLNGRFHGMVVDRTRERVTLFNDRWGMHRIYYHVQPAATYFAAEAKAILAVSGRRSAIDARSLGELIACGCVLGDRTVFEGIHVLPPGTVWVTRDGEAQLQHRYFAPEAWERQPPLDPASFYGELRDVFSETLRRHFNSGGRVGLSLTAGLDTRMIMAWDESAAGSLPCYSFGGESRDSHDVRTARKVAQHLGHPHEVIRVGREFLSNFASYAERAVRLSDGCVGVDRAPDVYLNEIARTIAPVRMTGNYGDEILRRVRAFKPVAPTVGLFTDEVVRLADAASETYAALYSLVIGSPSRRSDRRPCSILASSRSNRRQLFARSPFLDNEVVRLMFRAPAEASMDANVALRLIEDGDRVARTDSDGPRASRGTSVALRLRAAWNAGIQLQGGDTHTMPACPGGFQPLTMSSGSCGRNGSSLAGTSSRTSAFGIVTHSRHVVQEILLDRKALERTYLNRRAVEQVVSEHVRGTRNHTNAIHQLLTLELLHRAFIDAPVASRRD